jgi:hypothetical protein
VHALRALAAALVVVIPASGAGAARQERVVRVNTQLGTLEGVRMGDTAGAVERRLGPATYAAGFRPRSAKRFTGPPSIRSLDGIQPAVAQYRDHAFLIGSVGAYALTTVASGAVTQRGIRIGGRIDSVKAAHPKAKCGKYPGGEAGAYRWCSTRVGPNKVFFGGDPIESITIVRVGAAPRRPTSRVVEAVRGAYRGVPLGSTKRQASLRLGPAPAWSEALLIEPLVHAVRDASPTVPRAQTLDVLRYPDAAYLLSAGRVYAIVVGGNAAGPLPRGAAIGAKLDVARRPFRGLRCGQQARAGGGQPFRYCTGRVAPRRYLWLGDDPIASIVVANVSLR